MTLYMVILTALLRGYLSTVRWVRKKGTRIGSTGRPSRTVRMERTMSRSTTLFFWARMGAWLGAGWRLLGWDWWAGIGPREDGW